MLLTISNWVFSIKKKRIKKEKEVHSNYNCWTLLNLQKSTFISLKVSESLLPYRNKLKHLLSPMMILKEEIKKYIWKSKD